MQRTVPDPTRRATSERRRRNRRERLATLVGWGFATLGLSWLLAIAVLGFSRG